jgi:L-alanine-DL-glutamate epimerase-like enolase superfamily enzyme
MAMFDTMGKALNISICNLLRGKCRESVRGKPTAILQRQVEEYTILVHNPFGPITNAMCVQFAATVTNYMIMVWREAATSPFLTT